MNIVIEIDEIALHGFPPGERYAYSNTGYMLLAQILQRATGQSLGELSAVRIIEPLGMRGSQPRGD